MTDENKSRFPSTSRFGNNPDLPDLRYYNHVKDNKQVLVNNQSNNINYNPFNFPQQKTKANFPIDFFHLQNKITLSDIPLTDSIPVFQLNETQFQDPIKFIDSMHEMGTKYGAIKLVIPENIENSFKSNFQINSDLFWFQTNKLLNNSTHNELEIRLKFHQELIKFHLHHKKHEKLPETTVPNSEVQKESPIPTNTDPNNISTPDSDPHTKDSTPVPTSEVKDTKKPKLNLPTFLNKLPMIDKRPLDLYKLFKSVIIRGGFIEVVNKKLWAQIGRELGYKGKIMTSLSSSLKSSYLRILYPFEVYLKDRKYELAGAIAPIAEPLNQNTNNHNEVAKTPTQVGTQIEDEPPLIIGSSRDFKRSVKLKSSKGFLLNSPHLIDVKQPNTFISKDVNENEVETSKKRKKNGGESAIVPITPASQMNYGLKSIINNQSVYQDDSRLNLNGKYASVYNLRQFMEKDLKFQEYIIHHNKDMFNKINVNSNEKYFYQFNDQNVSVMERNVINLEKFEDLYWSFVMNEQLIKSFDNTPQEDNIDVWNDGMELENGLNLPSFINGSGFARIGDDFINYKNHLLNANANNNHNVNSTNSTNNVNNSNTYVKNSSPPSSIESNSFNSPDYINNLIQTSLNPWNLHNLPILPNSLLGGLSESDLNNQDLINPTLNIGMTFSTENWKCEDHFTQLCNYQFFGSYKKWYFIPELDFEKFELLIKEVNENNKERVNINNNAWNLDDLLKYFNNVEDTTNIEYESLVNSLENMINPSPDYNNSRMQHSNSLFQGIIDCRNQRREHLNYNQEFMITPTLLKQRGIKFTTTIQKPGEFIIKFPKTYSSTISFGLNLSEEVNFATKIWLDYAIEGEKWLNKQSILPNFLIFKLLINLAQLYESGSNNVFFNTEIYEKSLQMYTTFYKNELKLRDSVRKKFSHIRELVIDDKTFGDIDSIADDDLANTFPSKVVLTDVKLKQTFILSLARFLEYVELNELENDYNMKSVPKIIGNTNLKIELHLFYSDDKLKAFHRILSSYSIDYNEWMQNYERLMNENSDLSLRVYKSLLIDGKKIYLALSSSNFFHIFNNNPSNEPEDYETIKLNTFRDYIENLKLFVNDANEFIEECQSILSIKHQQRIRNGNVNNDFQRSNGDVLARLINLVDKIPTLNFSCSETEQILEFKVEIENFDRACRQLISKPKQSNSLQEFNDLINLGESFGVELPSLSFLIRLRDRLRWIDTYDKINSGSDPYNDKKDVFSLQDLKNFRDTGINLLGKNDLGKIILIDAIIHSSDAFNNDIVQFLKYDSADAVSFEELDSILSELETRSKAQGENRLFAYLDNYEKLVNLKHNSELIEQFKDTINGLQTDRHFTMHEMKQLQGLINDSALKFQSRVLPSQLTKAENWITLVWENFKELEIKTVQTKAPDGFIDDINPKFNMKDEIIERLLQVFHKNEFSFALSSDLYTNSSSYDYYKEDNDSSGDQGQQQIYCVCREFEYGTMIECDKCKEWYHTQCVDESAVESDDSNDDNYACPICKLIESGLFTDQFLSKQVTYRQLLKLLADGKLLSVYPVNELNCLEAVSNFTTEAFKNMNVAIDEIKQSKEQLLSKVDRLRFFLRKVYGAGILIEELLTDLLSTIRKFEYDLSSQMSHIQLEKEVNEPQAINKTGLQDQTFQNLSNEAHSQVKLESNELDLPSKSGTLPSDSSIPPDNSSSRNPEAISGLPGDSFGGQQTMSNEHSGTHKDTQVSDTQAKNESPPITTGNFDVEEPVPKYKLPMNAEPE